MKDKSKKTILIAESSATLGKLIQKTLEENGFSTILCQDGFEALKTAISKKPDCLIANKILSTIDGIQICSVLNQGYELTDISCILFSPEENSSDFSLFLLPPSHRHKFYQCGLRRKVYGT